MHRRRRSGVADTEEEVAELSLDELNAAIGRCIEGSERTGTGQGAKSDFQARRVVGKDEGENSRYSGDAPSLA